MESSKASGMALLIQTRDVKAFKTVKTGGLHHFEKQWAVNRSGVQTKQGVGFMQPKTHENYITRPMRLRCDIF